IGHQRNHRGYGNAQSANAGHAAHLLGIDSDTREQHEHLRNTRPPACYRSRRIDASRPSASPPSTTTIPTRRRPLTGSPTSHAAKLRATHGTRSEIGPTLAAG